jgi:CubicO group peptidase (beta-lactamase class C family)
MLQFLRLVLVSLAISAGVVSPANADDTANPDTSGFLNVKTVLDSFVDPNTTPTSGTVSGYTFGITNKSGLLFSASAGDYSFNQVIGIASATKLPSALTILTLVDAGLLDLDEPVVRYFRRLDPKFPWPREKHPITMRMLLSHTAGIPSPPYPQTTDCLGDRSTTLRQCAVGIAMTPLDYPPGSTFSYSGADYQVAGYLTELLSGMSWQDYFALKMATPLGLSTFTYGTTENPRIAGGGITNLDDYIRILRMVLNRGFSDSGQQVVSSAMICALETNEVAGLPVGFTPYPPNEVADYPGYGLSLWISSPSLYVSYGSAGPEFSDAGLYGATPWFDLSEGYASFLMIFQNTNVGISMWNAARPVIIGDLNGISSVTTTPAN